MPAHILEAIERDIRGEGVVNLSISLYSPWAVWHTPRMQTHAIPNHYKPPRFPSELSSHGVWLYSRVCLSYREGEERLCVRGMIVPYAALRKWGRTFGQPSAHQRQRRRPQPGDKGHVAEVGLTMHGERPCRWRAVAQDGVGLDLRVPRRRQMHAAQKFFRKLLTGCPYVPRGIITDKRKSDGAATREFLPGGEQRPHTYLKNRAENSHQPTRQRERRMQGGKSPGQAPRVRAAYGPMAQHVRPRRHRLAALTYRQEMQQRCATWQDSPSRPPAAYGAPSRW